MAREPKFDPIKTANDHNKALKQTIEHYRAIAKEQGMLTLEQAKSLKSARDQLKIRKKLTGEQQESLEKALKHSWVRQAAIKNVKSNLKSERTLGALQEKQLELQIEASKGELDIASLDAHKLEIEKAQSKLKTEIFGTSIDQRKVVADQLGLLTSQYDKMIAYNEVKGLQLEYEEQIKEKLDDTFPLLSKIKTQAGKFKEHLETAEGKSFLLKAGLVGVLAGVVALGKSMFDFAQETGLGYAQTAKLGPALIFAKDEARALLDEFGSVDVLTTSNLAQMKALGMQYGVSADSAAKLTAQMMAVSGSTLDSAISATAMVGELAQANGVAPAKVMEDLAGDTEFFASYAKDGGKNLMVAAVEARKLGLSMATTAKIAESLLDFESSIENQMQASILIGRNINTDMARRLALSGDMAGMQREVLKQVGSQAEFERMNMIQRKALASAFGVSTDELAKMIMNQEKLNSRTQEQIDLDKSRESMMQNLIKGVTDLQVKLEPVITAVGEAFVSALKFANEHLNGILWTVGLIATAFVGTKVVKGIMSWTQSIGGAIKWLIGKFTAAKVAKEALETPSPKAKGGKGGMLDSFSKIDPKKILAGAATMVILAGALWVTAKAMQEFSTGVDWKGVAMGIVSMVALAGVSILLGTFSPVAITGAIAMGILAGAMWILGKAMQEMSTAAVMFIPFIQASVAGITSLASIDFTAFLGLAGGFTALGLSMLPLSAGMTALAVGAALLMPFLPVLDKMNDFGLLGAPQVTTNETTQTSEPSAPVDMTETNTLIKQLITNQDILMKKLTQRVEELVIG